MPDLSFHRHISCGRSCGEPAAYLAPALEKVLCHQHAAIVAAERLIIPIEVAMTQALILTNSLGLHPLVHELNKDRRAA